MALGDKSPVVMGKEKGVAGGVATLGADGILAEAQRPSAAEILTLNGKSVEEALKSAGLPTGGLEGQALVKAGADSETPTKWGPWPSNPNLLLNWDFRNPVNRNGKGEYTNGTSLLYTIDKWMLNSTGYLSLQDDSVLFHKTGTYATIWNCFLKDNPKPGNTVTFSALCKVSSGAFLLAFQDNIYNTTFIPVTEEYSLVSLTKELTGNLSWIGFRDVSISNENNNLYIKAAKFEIGDQQTLAHQDADGNWVLNDPPNFDLQYSLCSQYSPITGEFVGSQHSNRNLLDNWYLADPVNQRNQDEYTGAGYIIDRWRNFRTNVVKLEDNKLYLYPATNNTSLIMQVIDNPNLLYNKDLTFSILVNVPENCQGRISADDKLPAMHVYTSFSTPGLQLISVSFNSGDWFNSVRIEVIAGHLELIAAKLELGPVQTLAHKEGDVWVLNDPPPDKALELAKCQEYQFVVGGGNNRHIGTFEIGTSGNKIFTRIAVTLPTTQRKSTPAVKILGSGSLRLVQIANQIKTVGTISSTQQPESVFLSENCCYITYETPGLTAGMTGMVDTTNVSTFLCIDNNL